MNDNFTRKPTDPLFVPEGGPGAANPPPKVFEETGEAGIRAMLLDFYKELYQSEIAGMFQGKLEVSAERSALFFIGLLGGPPLYHQTHGNPRMRMRHLPFKITPEFRGQWLQCFFKVLEDPKPYNFPEEQVPQFKDFLDSFSMWMVNSQD